MSGQILKLSNGATAVLRTGVIQGVGPVGPKGPRGDQGPVGDVGPTGETGPAGFVNEVYSAANHTTQNITTGAEVTVTFSDVVVDEMEVFTSSTVITPNGVSDLRFDGWLCFDVPAGTATGYRQVQIREASGNAIVYSISVPAVASGSTYVPITTTYRSVAGKTYSVFAKSTDALTVALSAGRLAVTRTGAGPAGVQGPAGPTGPLGPVGPEGPEGPEGDANSGFDTFDDL